MPFSFHSYAFILLIIPVVVGRTVVLAGVVGKSVVVDGAVDGGTVVVSGLPIQFVAFLAQ